MMQEKIQSLNLLAGEVMRVMPFDFEDTFIHVKSAMTEGQELQAGRVDIDCKEHLVENFDLRCRKRIMCRSEDVDCVDDVVDKDVYICPSIAEMPNIYLVML